MYEKGDLGVRVDMVTGLLTLGVDAVAVAVAEAAARTSDLR